MKETLAHVKRTTEQIIVLLKVQEDLASRPLENEAQAFQTKARYQENMQKILRLCAANKRILASIEHSDAP